jgi:hypothetical protein
MGQMAYKFKELLRLNDFCISILRGSGGVGVTLMCILSIYLRSLGFRRYQKCEFCIAQLKKSAVTRIT